MIVAQLVLLLVQGSAGPPWIDALISEYRGNPLAAIESAEEAGRVGATECRIVRDWLAQDGVATGAATDLSRLVTPIDQLGESGDEVRRLWRQLDAIDAPDRGVRRFELYLRACHLRRLERLAPYSQQIERVVYTIHFDMGGSHYAYTEAQSDAQNERNWIAGSSLNVLEMDEGYGERRVLLEDPGGVIRDPDVSWDGQRILFAWKKHLDEDDYHLYEMDVPTGEVRQLTHGLGVADYEGVYLPSGDIAFSSTRCIQTVDCWWTEVSNLYLLDPVTGAIRRAAHDQVHTNYPTVTTDGRVIYTRWDYSDRGQIFPQGLFEMRPDGTGQMALYGNNSYFPTTIIHARSIPGTGKYVATFTGHHTRQNGWLGILDPRLGREENSGAQLIAPVRHTPADRIDAYGQTGDQFQYPYPLSEDAFLAAIRPEGWWLFGVYWVNLDGERELLAWDESYTHSCNQPIPLQPRPRPPVMAPVAEGGGDAVVYMQDVYHGPGLAGLPRGTADALRVVALEFRAAGIGQNMNHGPAGGAMISTPISKEGAWDVKRVLGTVPIEPDGSACFRVPADTALYFQVVDDRGHAVQTMRSWTSLRPGETFSCVGCHEDPNSAAPNRGVTMAVAKGPVDLQPFEPTPTEDPDLAAIDGFDFRREIQPILDANCVRCHYVPPVSGQSADAAETILPTRQAGWRYSLTEPEAGWEKPELDDSAWAEGAAGFGMEGTPNAPIATPWTSERIWLRRSFELDAVPDNPALLAHHDDDMAVWINGVHAATTGGYRQGYGLIAFSPEAAATLRPGTNTLAVHAWQTVGGQFVDVGLVDLAPPEDAEPGAIPVFSLRADERYDEPSRKGWSDAYNALASRGITDWINAQSVPSMLPPYHAGAVTSPLMRLLEEGHHGVRLSDDEVRRIALWIDLLVPYYGDYEAGLSATDRARYRHFMNKRHRVAEADAHDAANFAEPMP